ncbi:MAG: cytochrome c family protein [Verrucomicrobiota bacterium]|nr:cytochrome c family protein [Verrucomicrobiota bacterium]
MSRIYVLAILLCAIAGSGLEAQQVRLEGARFVGAAGCKSSGCHGGAGEKRSQYITWAAHDVHTRGYAILTNARSERIAAGLGLGQMQNGPPAATTSARCTVCHSPLQTVPPAQRVSNFDPAESVSCESCHGAAGTWLRGHTRPDWTYAMRVGAGMRDLKSIYVRANTCVACHQNLDSDIVAAGHPTLTFELQSQTVAEPRHWKDAPDTGMSAWLVGQAVALRETSWWRTQATGGDAATAAAADGLAWLLTEATAADRSLPAIDASAAGAIQQQADALARRAALGQFSRETAARVLRRLAGLGSTFTDAGAPAREALYQRALRLTLALVSLTTTNGPTGAHLRLGAELQRLQQDVASPVSFDAAQFAADMDQLRATLGPSVASAGER